jgi:hypothetical protein
MDESSQVFVLRVSRTDFGVTSCYDTVWDVKDVPGDVVHYLLDHLRESIAGPRDGLYRITAISHYGECSFRISKSQEEFPF